MQARSFGKRNAKRCLVALAAVLVLSGLAFCAMAGDKGSQGNPGVLPPNSKPYGASYGEWGAKWWQWALSIPVSDNPLFDETGANAGVGQSGPVFFLAGVINVSGTAERTITVPSGKALFFPILNFEADNVAPPFIPPGTPLADEIAALYALASDIIATTSELHATIDGVPVQNLFAYRGTSPQAFTVNFPATDNVFQFFGFDVSGPVYPIVSDGFWLMVAPLPVGEHTITFGGTFGPPINFSLSITYHITVVPGNR